jgi:hypothetical protein
MIRNQKSYQETIEIMNELVESLGDVLPNADIAHVKMLLENKEPGIAFQELCGSIVENSISIKEGQKHAIESLFSRMEGSKNEFWEEINLSEHIKNMKIQ